MLSSSNLHFRVLKNGNKKQKTLMYSSFKYDKTLKRTIISFLEQGNKGCLQQPRDCQKRVFIVFPTVFCINFTRALSFLIQVCTRTDEVGKITDVFVSSSILSAGSLLQNAPEKSSGKSQLFPNSPDILNEDQFRYLLWVSAHRAHCTAEDPPS